VKPANILLTPEGIPKIADFGLAHLRGSRTLLTDSGATMGTPAYMSPEQVQGRIGEIGPQTDVYALGMVLYEILTGVLAHEGNTPVKLYNKIVEEDPVRPRIKNPSAPEDLETICLKALSKESARRYANATAFADDLRRWLDDEPIEARPASWIYRIRRKVAKRKALAGAVSGLAVVFGILITVLIAQQSREDAHEEAVKLVMEGNQLARNADQLDEAIKSFTRAIELDPEYAVAYNNQGLVRYKRGDFLGAIRDFTRAIELDPGFPEPHFNRGLARRKAMKTHGLDYGLATISSESEGDRGIQLPLRSILIDGEEYIKKPGSGDFPVSTIPQLLPIKLLTFRIERNHPASNRAYYERGKLYLDMGDSDAAIADFQKALEISPPDWPDRGKARDLLKRAREALQKKKTILDGIIKDYTKAIELSSEFNQAYYERGMLYLVVGNLDGAVADLRRTLEASPPDWPDRMKVQHLLKGARESLQKKKKE
jgi:tetratricopeptide (TPR) repeat protein